MSNWKPRTDEELDAQIEAARSAADANRASEVRAVSARYDRASRRVIIELTSGATLLIPVDRIEALQGATDDDLAAVEANPLGDGIAWSRLDWHHGLAALMAGRYGSRAWMERLYQAQSSRAADA